MSLDNVAKSPEKGDAQKQPGESANLAHGVYNKASEANWKQMQAGGGDVVLVDPLANADAAYLRKLTGNDNFIDKRAQTDDIIAFVQNRTPQQREQINTAYEQRYGISLTAEMCSFMKGSDRERFLSAMNNKGENMASQHSDRIHSSLTELGEIGGRSHSIIEKDIRDTLRMANSQQIAAMSKEYLQKHGITLADELRSHKDFSPETKAAINVYLKGSENRRDEDSLKLLNAAVSAKNLDMFSEVARDSSKYARHLFMNDGGYSKIKDAFDHLYSSRDYQHALDLQSAGRVSTMTQISENTGMFSTNKAGVDLAISNMTAGERQQFNIGRYLSEKNVQLSPQDSDALNDMMAWQRDVVKRNYQEMHKALNKAGDKDEVSRWENMIVSGKDKSDKAPDILQKLDSDSHAFKSNEIGKAVLEIKDEMRRDPDFARKVLAPKNAEEKSYAVEFIKQAKITCGEKTYNEVIRPMLATRELPLTAAVKLDILDKPETILAALGQSNEVQRNQVMASPELKEKLLSHLDKEERAIMLHVAQQGQYRPEDRLQYLVHAGKNGEMLDVLKSIAPKDVETVRQEYARKYSGSLDADVMEHMRGQEKIVAKTALGGVQSDLVRLDRLRDQVYQSRSGVGAWATDNVFRNGSGLQIDEAINAQQQVITNYYARRPASAAEYRSASDVTHKALMNFVENKESTSDKLITAGGAVGTVVALPFAISGSAIAGVALGSGYVAGHLGKHAYLGRDQSTRPWYRSS